jgi:hypothetical protein
MVKTLSTYWNGRPLLSVMVIALVIRLLAAIFSQGYLMHDDHFLVVETAASWADGEDYDDWLPWNQTERLVHPANFAYVGSQFLIIEFFQMLGIDDPKSIAFLLRLLHGFYSLLIVYFGFRITAFISGKENARLVGLLLGLLAFMPAFSVHQLVEMICIPPLMWASWVLLKNQDNLNWKNLLIASIGIGIATGVRFQCGVFGVGFGLVLLLRKQWKEGIILGFGSLVVFSIMQLPDVFIWGEPFTQLKAYVGYNSTQSGNYPNGPGYMFLGTIAGFLVPPLSLALMFGFFTSWKKQLLLFLPAFIFLAFHSIFPNKQERFILPVLPYFVILGIYGWSIWVTKSKFWTSKKSLLRGLWIAFWVINSLGLAVLTFSYGKKSRVEAMYHLYEQGDLNNFLVVHAGSGAMPPQFYSGSWMMYYVVYEGTDLELQKAKILKSSTQAIPNYILFYGDKEIPKYVETLKQAYPNMELDTIVDSGKMDRLLNWLNPVNSIEEVHIYKVNMQETAY